jgi:carbon monoxide dehydrogenase subunit G
MSNNTLVWSAFKRPGGRSGIGAVNHCAHGKGVLQATIVDWHPFDYFTVQGADGKMKFHQTTQFQPSAEGEHTLVSWRWTMDMGFPRFVNKLIGKGMLRMNSAEMISQIDRYLNSMATGSAGQSQSP